MRGRVLALVLALILSASTAIAAPTPKAGASCPKQGSSKTYKGNKFTCIKSGKKLVWSKAVPTKSASGSNTSGTSQSPTPNPSSATDPRDPQNLKTVTIHYKRTSGDYRGWNLWIWRNSDDNLKDYPVSPNGVPFQSFDDFGAKVSIPIHSMREFKDIGFYLRLDTGRDRDIDFDRFITQFNSSGFAEIWLIQNDPIVYTQRPDTGESPKPSPSPSSAPSPTPTSTPSKAAPPIPAGVKAALDDLGKFPKSKEAPQQIKFHFGPNADKRLSDLIEKNANATMQFFVDFYQISTPYPVFYSSPVDKDWAISEMAKNGYKLRGEWTDESHFFDPASGGDWNGSYLYWFYKEDWSGEKGFDLYSVTRQDWVNHHIVHGIQNRITGGRDRYLGIWAREGGATFYAWYIIGRTFPEVGKSSLGNVTYSVWRSEQTKPVRPWFAPTLNLLELSETEWLSFIKSWDCNLYKFPSGVGGTIYKPCPEIKHQQLAYPTGAIMYERLVGEFGHQKVMDWWYEIRTTPDWEEAFTKTFKINIDDWYKRSAIPYLMQVFKDWVPISSR